MVIYQSVICPGCGSLCNDIEILVEDGGIKTVRNACSIGTTKFLKFGIERNLTPYYRQDGALTPTSMEDAIERTAKMLVSAEYPIIYGWSLTSCEAQSLGVELAEECGGVIDNSTTVCHGPSIIGVQEMGEPSSTLGEVRHRADLIVYWGSNPEEAHPGHMKKYSARIEGRFRRQRKDRRVIVIDVRRTPSARQADEFIQIEPNQDYELISALRMALQNDEIEDETVAGLPVEKIEELAEELRSCEFGMLFFGVGLTMSLGKERNIDAAISLVRELNRWTKFVIMPMRGHFNVTGANKVFSWQMGFPYALDLSRGYPWYNPGETSVVDILNRGESDAALIVASDPVANFPRKAVEHLCHSPFAAIDPHMSLTAMAADIVMPCAFIGIEASGTAYRMDGVGLIMKKLIDPPAGIMGDAEILTKILQTVRRLKGVS